MAELADIADHVVVLGGGQHADALEAQLRGQVAAPVDARLAVLFRRGDDEVCGGKVDLGAVGDAARLAARHRVAGDKFHTLRQGGLHRLDHTALDTGHIRDHRAGADELTVLFDPVQQHGGVEAEDDAVGLPYQILKIRIFTGADVAMLQGIVQR